MQREGKHGEGVKDVKKRKTEWKKIYECGGKTRVQRERAERVEVEREREREWKQRERERKQREDVIESHRILEAIIRVTHHHDLV